VPTAPEIRVAGLAATPVKGLRVAERTEVTLGEGGMLENRRFFLIGADGRMVNGKEIGALQSVEAGYREEDRRLSLRFADGTEVSGAAEPGETIETRFFSQELRARHVPGPWEQALSALAGRPLRVVQPGPERPAVDRGRAGAVSVISRGSLSALAAVAGTANVDPRRFRMLIEVEGPAAHEEDGWVGRRVSIGSCVVRMNGHVGRCLVTTLDPESGEVTLPTLDLLGSYRRGRPTTEALAFGIYGEVLEPGTVRVGDLVSVLEEGT
jgi:uncharacterized protein YcbX